MQLISSVNWSTLKISHISVGHLRLRLVIALLEYDTRDIVARFNPGVALDELTDIGLSSAPAICIL